MAGRKFSPSSFRLYHPAQLLSPLQYIPHCPQACSSLSKGIRNPPARSRHSNTRRGLPHPTERMARRQACTTWSIPRGMGVSCISNRHCTQFPCATSESSRVCTVPAFPRRLATFGAPSFLWTFSKYKLRRWFTLRTGTAISWAKRWYHRIWRESIFGPFFGTGDVMNPYRYSVIFLNVVLK